MVHLMPSAFDLFLAARNPSLPADKALETAWNAALEAAAGICRDQIASMGVANPGRSKGSVSQAGLFGQGILEACEQRIRALSR
tara:strand:+ start:975 stop:1226 length:252 start_codon:yes stop_codon:yes gene_type:complete